MKAVRYLQNPIVRQLRFYVSSGGLYILTIAFVWFAVRPLPSLNAARPVALTKAAQRPYVPSVPQVPTISGRPVRIVIPDSGVDLPVDPGYYDAATDSWTLSGYHAQFAMSSTLANNRAGETFLYGHNNNYVFGALRHNTPAGGSEALIYTDNGHIFAYRFMGSESVGPDDVSVLSYSGSPILTIQTCTGSLNEWRTMFRYNFDRIVQ